MADHEDVADLLDELLQAFEEGTPGGDKRVRTRDRLEGSSWDTRWPLLEREARDDVIRRVRQRNQRAASRRRQAPKRREVIKTMRRG